MSAARIQSFPRCRLGWFSIRDRRTVDGRTVMTASRACCCHAPRDAMDIRRRCDARRPRAGDAISHRHRRRCQREQHRRYAACRWISRGRPPRVAIRIDRGICCRRPSATRNDLGRPAQYVRPSRCGDDCVMAGDRRRDSPDRSVRSNLAGGRIIEDDAPMRNSPISDPFLAPRDVYAVVRSMRARRRWFSARASASSSCVLRSAAAATRSNAAVAASAMRSIAVTSCGSSTAPER